MVGYSAILLSLLVTIIGGFSYFNLHVNAASSSAKKEKNGKFTLKCYRLSTLFAGLAAGYLFYLILDNRFDYSYVFNYSSRSLAFAYKISAFWAGQQGSFMLWLLFHVGFGLFLSQKKETPAGVMVVHSVVQAMLLIALLVKSPFMLMSPAQTEGIGLNPLLQDFWMTIHPPIIFLGYAGLAVPFAYALEGLFSHKHKDWIKPALPWALFSWCALGAGVFIGAFWSYKVLGWGGYWAWDPVGNSSLVPWLVGGALVHALYWARLKPAAVQVAYLTSIFSFVTVLYGTFLTRSGVLSDFSTHSFADEGIGGLLAGFVLLALCAGLIMLIIRWPELPVGQLYEGIKSREFLLGCSVLVLSLMAVLVFIGMSTPLVTMLLGNPSNVSGSFYNQTSLPLAIALVILLTLLPMVKANKPMNIRHYGGSIGVFLLSLTIPFAPGLYQPLIVLAIAFSVTAVVMNAVMVGGENHISWSGTVAHVGLGIMVIGIVVSSAGSQTLVLKLDTQQPQQAFGRNFIYQGVEKASDGSGFYQKFAISGGGIEDTVVRPYTKYNKDGNPSAREPGIERRLFADLYVAPVMQHDDHEGKEIILKAGEENQQNGAVFKFIRAGMAGGIMGQEMRVQALIEVTQNGLKEEIRPELIYKNNEFIGNAAKAFGRYEVMINHVNPTEGKISIDVIDRAATTAATSVEVEISHKPLMNLVWLGAFLITLGSGWAVIK